MWEEMDRNRLFPRSVRAVLSFGRGLLGDWDDDPGVAPQALLPVDSWVVADSFSDRDKLLAWWGNQRHPRQASGYSSFRRKTASPRKVLKSSK